MLLIDSADGALADPQLAWLEAVLDSQLRAARRGSVPRVLPVWIHHPVITGFHAYMDASYPLRNADALRELFTRGGHDLRIILFCGHYHCEDQRSLGPLTQWTTPSLYSQIDPNSRELTILPAGAGLRIVRWADDEEIETAVVYREP